MHYVSRVHIEEALRHLREVAKGFLFRQPSLRFHQRVKRPAWEELENNVDVLTILEPLVKGDDVLVVEGREEGDLVFNVFFSAPLFDVELGDLIILARGVRF